MDSMIVVTRLNNSQFAINPDLIERIHSNPDTTLVMVDGAKYIVTESMEQVIDKIATYRARVIALTHELSQSGQPAGVRALGLVSSIDPAGHHSDINNEADGVTSMGPRKL
jgi:flagellar protein FlbD